MLGLRPGTRGKEWTEDMALVLGLMSHSEYLFPLGFEEGLTVATVVESALCALRNCLAFMPPGKVGVWCM